MGNGQPALRRAVSRWQIVGLALNDVIGSGVYLLPAAAAALLGPASLWAVLAAGLAVSLLVLCFAEAAGHFDQPGSAYLYARTAFGAFMGLEVGWMTWLARVASVASLSVGFAQAVSYLWPQAGHGAGRAAAITVPLLALTAINVTGIRSGVGAAVFLVGSKLLPLLLFVGTGVFVATWSRVSSQPPGEGRFGEAALLLLFAYAGFENTAAPAGEYRNPKRDIPFALIANIVVVTTLYVAVQWVTLGTLSIAARSETPLADAAGSFLGSWAGLIMTLGAALSILGTNSNTVLAGPRYLLALARDGFGPRAVSRIDPRYRTPAFAIILQTAIALPLALTGSFVALAALSVVARLTTYIGTALAVPVLRRRLGPPAGGFVLPGGPAVPAAAVLLSLVLLSGATTSSLIVAGAALAAGALIWVTRRR